VKCEVCEWTTKSFRDGGEGSPSDQMMIHMLQHVFDELRDIYIVLTEQKDAP